MRVYFTTVDMSNNENIMSLNPCHHHKTALFGSTLKVRRFQTVNASTLATLSLQRKPHTYTSKSFQTLTLNDPTFSFC